jgi:hypothetical protein
MPLGVLLQNLQFLNCSHFVDDSLEDPSHSLGTERAAVMSDYVREDLVFALRLVNGHLQGLFDTADLFHDGSTVIQEFQDLPVNLINALTAPAEVFNAMGTHAERSGAERA